MVPCRRGNKRTEIFKPPSSIILTESGRAYLRTREKCDNGAYAPLAVQWHPEDQARIDPAQLNIFRRFGAAMGKTKEME